jgi:hypothetical protein
LAEESQERQRMPNDIRGEKKNDQEIPAQTPVDGLDEDNVSVKIID